MSYTYKKFTFDPDVMDGPTDLRSSEILSLSPNYITQPGTSLANIFDLNSVGVTRINLYNISTNSTDDTDAYRIAIRDNNTNVDFYMLWSLDMGPHTSLTFFNKFNQLFLNNHDMLFKHFGPASATGSLKLLQSTIRHIGSSA